MARAGRLRCGGHILPHAAGGIRQFLRRLLGKSEQAALLPQQKRLLRLQSSGKRTAKLRVTGHPSALAASTKPMAARQSSTCAHRTRSSSLFGRQGRGFSSGCGGGAAFSHMAYTSPFSTVCGRAKNIRPIYGADSRGIGRARSLPPLTRRGSCATYRSVLPAAWRAWQKAPARSHPVYILHWWSHRRPAAAP